MKILVAVDGSEHSNVVLEKLVTHANWLRDRPTITLVNVHVPIPYGGAAAYVGKDTVNQYYNEESQKVLEPAKAALAAKGAQVETVALVGEPADEIVRYATQNRFDLIAMGTHGRKGLSNLVLGSVAMKVLAQTKVPVLLIR